MRTHSRHTRVPAALVALAIPAVALVATPASPASASPATSASSTPAADLAVPVAVSYTAESASGVTVNSVLTPNRVAAHELAASLRHLPGVTAANVTVPLTRADSTSPTPIGQPITRQAADPRISRQWGLPTLDFRNAWKYSRGQNVSVAVIDDGVDSQHPDLTGAVLPGINIISPARPVDPGYHGSHVAGIIAARAGNGIGGAGYAPSVRVLPVDVFDSEDSTDDVTVARGIYWAAGRKVSGLPLNTTRVRVINLSLGGPESSSVLRNAVAYAQSKGIVVVAAAGNEGPGTMSYPAGFPGVLGVGAVDRNQQLASFSSTGKQVDLVGPGVDVFSTTCLGFIASTATCTAHAYEYMSGTSMATPFVSASAALLVSRFPSWSASRIAKELIRTARDLGVPGRDDEYGSGLVRPIVDLVGAPGKPTSVAISSNPTITSTHAAPTITVNWTAPAQRGSYGIGSWRVSYSYDGTQWQTRTVAGTARSTTLTLPTQRLIRVRVEAAARVTAALGPARLAGPLWHALDPGTTLATARPLSLGAPSSDVIRVTGDIDWYRFTPGDTAPFRVAVTRPQASGAVVSVRPIVAGVAGAAIATAPAGTPFDINPALVTGTPTDWVVVVSGNPAPTAPYSVRITPAP